MLHIPIVCNHRKGTRKPQPTGRTNRRSRPTTEGSKMPIESFVIPFCAGLAVVILIALVIKDEDTAFLVIVTYILLFLMTAIPLSSMTS